MKDMPVHNLWNKANSHFIKCYLFCQGRANGYPFISTPDVVVDDLQIQNLFRNDIYMSDVGSGSWLLLKNISILNCCAFNFILWFQVQLENYFYMYVSILT